MKTEVNNIDFFKLLRNTKKLKEELITEMSKAQLTYYPKDDMIIIGRGDYGIHFEESVKRELTKKWKVWFEQVRPLCKHNEEYQELININQNVECGWRIRNNELSNYISRIEALFAGIEETIRINIDYSSYYNENNDIIINVAAKTFAINISDVKVIYDGIEQMIDKAEMPSEQQQEIKNLIKEGKSEPKDVGKFKQVFDFIHTNCSKYSPELTLLSTLLQPLL